MLKDRIMAGALLGIFADAVKLTANFIMYKLGWSNVVFWQIVAARFLDKKDLYKPSALLIGAVADIIVSATLGIVFIYFILVLGRQFLVFKGIGYGLAIWVILFGTLLGQSVESEIPPTPSGILVTLIAHFIFGLSIAIFAMLLLKILPTSNTLLGNITSLGIKSPFIPEPSHKPTSSGTKTKQTAATPIKIKPKRLKRGIKLK